MGVRPYTITGRPAGSARPYRSRVSLPSDERIRYRRSHRRDAACRGRSGARCRPCSGASPDRRAHHSRARHRELLVPSPRGGLPAAGRPLYRPRRAGSRVRRGLRRRSARRRRAPRDRGGLRRVRGCARARPLPPGGGATGKSGGVAAARCVGGRGGQLPSHRASVGSVTVRRRVPTGAAAGWPAADVDAQPDHLHARQRHPDQSVPHPRTQRRRTDRTAGRRGFRDGVDVRGLPRPAAA